MDPLMFTNEDKRVGSIKVKYCKEGNIMECYATHSRLWRAIILNIRGLFEEHPLMKNCGITSEKGRN